MKITGSILLSKLSAVDIVHLIDRFSLLKLTHEYQIHCQD
jgi:hypothetical protein